MITVLGLEPFGSLSVITELLGLKPSGSLSVITVLGMEPSGSLSVITELLGMETSGVFVRGHEVIHARSALHCILLLGESEI